MEGTDTAFSKIKVIMPETLIYTTQFCPFCIRAKHLLNSKNVAFKEIKVDNNPQLRAEMTQKSGRRTVPQIWIGKQHIGGCDDLYALEKTNKLDILFSQTN